MEGQSSLTNTIQMLSMGFCGNAADDISEALGYNLNQQVMMEAGRTADQTDVLSLPWWIQPEKPSHNYVEYLAESSAFVPKSPCEDMWESIPSSVVSIHDVGRVSEFQRDGLYSGLDNACGSKSTDFSRDMDSSKMKLLSLHNDELVNAQHQLPMQYHTSRTDNPNWDSYDSVSQVDPRATIDTPGSLCQPHHIVSKQRTFSSEYNRRMRIGERLSALQELLPEPAEGRQVCVLDDVIDQIKFLKLQIKDLSRSRLGGEPIAEPIIFREGYGHYFCHQQMLNEPLEEMIGNLLEVDVLAASELLEKKGLLLLPMEYSEDSA
ncbi:hypothetical protein TB2_030744 [Malus domestica]|uniref:transcription factor bHLH7 n=1 Tax=Malus sylvestris TaxID=3752 RepID=UPI0021AC6BC9|nr:transcription factor bHLH7 [Malus sylvestris]XP_050141510.1 transcription factor bHLH7 [Malus sylvestris]XP_050141511.1 transcription factor bHLH7 [Malus sylvestris]